MTAQTQFIIKLVHDIETKEDEGNLEKLCTCLSAVELLAGHLDRLIRLAVEADDRGAA